MASPYANADTDVNKVEVGKFVATFVEAKRHNKRSGEIQLLLSYKFGPNQGKNSGKKKDEFFQISSATEGNRDWTLKRCVESFKFTKDEVVAATAHVTTAEQEVEAMVKLLNQRAGRKVVVSLVQRGNYVNIEGGEAGVRPLTAEEEANGLADYTEDLATPGSTDPWSTDDSSEQSVDDILSELGDDDEDAKDNLGI